LLGGGAAAWGRDQIGEAGPPRAGEEGERQEWREALPCGDWQAGRGAKCSQVIGKKEIAK
jgi:hypothetical protein